MNERKEEDHVMKNKEMKKWSESVIRAELGEYYSRPFIWTDTPPRFLESVLISDYTFLVGKNELDSYSGWFKMELRAETFLLS